MKAHTAAIGAGPSPAAQPFAVVPLVTHASVGAPTFTYSRPVASNTNCFIKCTLSPIVLPSGSLMSRAGKPCTIVSTVRAGSAASGSKRKIVSAVEL